jgi:hypothetical protein
MPQFEVIVFFSDLGKGQGGKKRPVEENQPFYTTGKLTDYWQVVAAFFGFLCFLAFLFLAAFFAFLGAACSAAAAGCSSVAAGWAKLVPTTPMVKSNARMNDNNFFNALTSLSEAIKLASRNGLISKE